MDKGPWQVQIVTDELMLMLAVSRAYRNKSVDIITASNVEKAQAQLDVFKFDLFLLDLDIKDGSSLDLLTFMTVRYPKVPVILMTTGEIESKPLIARIEAIRSHYCWHLLEKPFDYKKLTGFIDRGLQEYQDADLACHPRTPEQFERRRCQRSSRFEQIPMIVSAAVSSSSQTISLHVTLTDISVGGIGVTASSPLTLNAEVHFDKKFMHQSGIVIWSEVQQNQTWRSGLKFT